MASSKKILGIVKISDGASVVKRKRQDFEKELASLRDEAARISEELKGPIIPSQRESREVRLDILQEEIGKTEDVLARIRSSQGSAEKACRQFDPVTLPKNWFVGLIEPLPENQELKKPILERINFRRFCWLAIFVIAVAVIAAVFLADNISSQLLAAGLAGVSVILIISLFSDWNDFVESLEDLSPPPHSVFGGVIPTSALQLYDALKAAGLFDQIMIASPSKEAFVQIGARYDPVMVGVVGLTRIRFDWTGFATVESFGLNRPDVFLFEIARWDTADDLKNL